MATQAERIAVTETRLDGIDREIRDLKVAMGSLENAVLHPPSGGSNGASRREQAMAQVNPKNVLLLGLLIDALSQRI